ncbi:MAG: DNA mismatch repair protein MutS [Acidobacteria bacterium]|nr:DNA mismatch repair protein MutS [Acidobacteriota bacterium]
MNESEGSTPKSLPTEGQVEPRIEYTQRRAARLGEAAARMRRFRTVGVARLVALAFAIAVGWLVYGGLTAWWLLPPVIGFLALADMQQRITQARRRCERAAALYDQGLARLDDHWAGMGATGARFLDESHPYAADLDLFGHGSLFELLSRARTRVGEQTLANWLLAPAAPEVVRARQAAVVELRPLLDLREDMALLGEGVRSGEDAQTLAQWAAAPPWQISRSTRIIALSLAVLALATLALWIAGFGPIPFLLSFAIGRAYSFRMKAAVEHVINSVDGPGRDLTLLSELLRRLERERFTSPRLVELRAALDVEGMAPSQQIARLNRLIDLLDARRNMIFAIVAPALLWPLQFALAIESWRQSSGAAVARWLAAVGELEALGSLAGYSYEHPNDPFPELTDGTPCFDGEALGHPLIPAARSVRTDLRLSEELQRVLIVSGSNMSGKSTLLRTVGTNTVLALAGAPVRARALRLTPLNVGASIRVQDSLLAGASRFYAEITRLRQIVGLTEGALPVLFLLDEILHGTNSHDRRIGAEGVVRGLIERGAIGLITTHDLALARIAETLAPRAANVHFEDQLEGGKMTFDYLLRPGTVQRSNALELMRSVGLEV